MKSFFETKECNNQTHKLITWMDEHVQMIIDPSEKKPYFVINKEECRRAAIEIFGDIKSLSTRICTAMCEYRKMNEMTVEEIRWSK